MLCAYTSILKAWTTNYYIGKFIWNTKYICSKTVKSQSNPYMASLLQRWDEDAYTLEVSTAKYEDGILYSNPRSQLSLLTLYPMSTSASSRFQPKGPSVHLPRPVSSGQMWVLCPFPFRKRAYDIPTILSILHLNSSGKKWNSCLMCIFFPRTQPIRKP